MFWLRFLLTSGLMLLGTQSLTADAPAAIAQAPTPIQGVINEITKDEDTPTGSITLTDGTGKVWKFMVGQITEFQMVRGTAVWPGNFLREHVGEKAQVTPLANSDNLVAGTVQILLPPAGPPRLYPVHGRVVGVDATSITIHVPVVHLKPQLPVVGVLTDVQFNQNNQTGTMTLNVNGQAATYTVTPWTRFVKVNNLVYQPSNFLQEYRGETVVVYLGPGTSTVATQVDVILSGPVPPLGLTKEQIKANILKYAMEHAEKHKHTHILTYLVTSATTYQFVRDGKIFPATFANVAIGEWVAILPTGFHSKTAQQVTIRLPHALHGEVVSLAPGTATLKVHHHATADKVAYDDNVTVILQDSTTYVTVQNKVVQPATLSALKVGLRVVVFRTAVPPHPAEKVDIHLPPATYTSRGILMSGQNGTIVISVKHATKEKPANAVQETYQVTASTVVVLASNQQPIVANLGDDVTVSGPINAGVNGPADRVEVRPAVAKAVTFHGAFVSSTSTSLTIKTNHAGKEGKKDHTTQDTFVLAPTTQIVLASNQQATTLQPGDELTIHAQSRTGVTGPVDKIEVRRKKK